MRHRLQISFVAGDLASGGGVNKVIRDLSSLFAEKFGANVSVIGIGTDGAPTYQFSDSVIVETIADRDLSRWAEGLRRIRRSGAEFVIGSWTQENVLLILGALLSRSRVIAMEHMSWYFQPRWVRALRRLIYPLAWRVIVLNPSELAYYRRHLSNVRLLPNPVPAIAVEPAPSREKLIVAVGHLEPRKNFKDAIRAMARSGLEPKGWELAIIGSGPEEDQLHALIKQEGLERTSIYPPTPDIGSWYRRSSLTLVTAKLEVFSLVLAEAMSAGVIPIAYATDGPSYILKDFPDHLVPVGDVEVMAERMRRFAGAIDSNRLRGALSSSIDRRFSPEIIVERWQELFADAS